MQGIVGNNPCHVLYREVPYILYIIAIGCADCSHRRSSNRVINRDRLRRLLPQARLPQEPASPQKNLEMAFEFHAAQAATGQPGQGGIGVLFLHLGQCGACLVPLF